MFPDDYDENEHSKELYAHFGLAVYYSQVLEHQFANMIVLLRKSQGLIPSKDEYDALYERQFSKTMGKLINEIKQQFNFEADEINDLKEILKIRNYIVHDYFKEKITLSFTPIGREEMIDELMTFVDRVKVIDNKLEKYLNVILKKLGITNQMLEDEMKIVKEEELKKSI